MKDDIPKIITRAWLAHHPQYIFVFGDNLVRRGTGGQAVCRGMHNSYGFITKRMPNYRDASYYHTDNYPHVFKHELDKLKKLIESSPDKIFLIPKIGGGLANKYRIWEQIIEPGLRCLSHYSNVVFLYEPKGIETWLAKH